MKSILTVLAVTLASAQLAQATSTTLTCFAGGTKADGSFSYVSGNPATVIVVTDTIALYSLKNEFGIYNAHYNINKPFPMSLVNAYGPAGSYTMTGTAISAKWLLSDNGTQKMTATFTADSGNLKGHINTETDNDAGGAYGGFVGSTDDDVVCGLAGTQ